MIEYEGTDDTIMGGVGWKTSKKLEIQLNGVWVEADAALDPFAIAVPASFLAANPNMAFDFSLAHLNSDVDVSRIEVALSFSYDVNQRLGVVGSYRYLDYEDSAPVLYDTSGSLGLVSLGAAWSF